MNENDVFSDLLAQLSDGARWKVLSGEGRREFAERLTAEIVELKPRRRQAVIMALFALLAGDMQPDDLAAFLRGRDLHSDETVDAFIEWLRDNYDPEQ